MFRAIARYLGVNEVETFQFENVIALANKPMKQGKEMGPSNLSAVCAVLHHEAQMWTHVWHLDSREFGSGQQRQRLWGCGFRTKDLQLSLSAAHDLLDSTMNSLVGVGPCHPSEYLLEESSQAVKSERCLQAVRCVSPHTFVEKATRIDTLFQTGGTLPTALQATKRRRLKQHPSDPSPSGAKWVQVHQQAFRERGEDPCFIIDKRLVYSIIYIYIIL